MRDALNLAWKLERVIQHGAPDQLLDTYEQERRPHVKAVTQAAIALGEVICERDPVRATERDQRLLAEQGGQVKTVLRQDLIPGLTSGLIDYNSPDAGSVLPQPIVHTDSFEGRLDDATGRTVRAVAVDPLLPADRAALLEALARLGGVLVQLGTTDPAGTSALNVIDDEDVLGAWLRRTGQRIAIARPDHYVYGTASSADEAVVLLKGLDEWLVGPRP
jgi:3-(3-hydroxy-phenyl)propionate hydroxylase